MHWCLLRCVCAQNSTSMVQARGSRDADLVSGSMALGSCIGGKHLRIYLLLVLHQRSIFLLQQVLQEMDRHGPQQLCGTRAAMSNMGQGPPYCARWVSPAPDFRFQSLEALVHFRSLASTLNVGDAFSSPVHKGGTVGHSEQRQSAVLRLLPRPAVMPWLKRWTRGCMWRRAGKGRVPPSQLNLAQLRMSCATSLSSSQC